MNNPYAHVVPGARLRFWTRLWRWRIRCWCWCWCWWRWRWSWCWCWRRHRITTAILAAIAAAVLAVIAGTAGFKFHFLGINLRRHGGVGLGITIQCQGNCSWHKREFREIHRCSPFERTLNGLFQFETDCARLRFHVRGVAQAAPSRIRRGCQGHRRFNVVNAGLAQLVEHLICNQGVVGSSPITGTMYLLAKRLQCIGNAGNAHFELDVFARRGGEDDGGFCRTLEAGQHGLVHGHP